MQYSLFHFFFKILEDNLHLSAKSTIHGHHRFLTSISLSHFGEISNMRFTGPGGFSCKKRRRKKTGSFTT
uniref:Uncharacterized protein n=1 Tax=Pygocentrus nattereri TaxID=42514 RepID=A0AAR2KQK0_PYGNA